MRLILKQRLLSFLDSYDIYDDVGNVVFVVNGRLSIGHCLEIYYPDGSYVGTLKQRVMCFMPTYDISIGGRMAGCIKRRFSFFTPRYDLDFCGWTVVGDVFQLDYSVYDGQRAVMTVSKKLFSFSDTYAIDVFDDRDALAGLMIALAIDADKCSRN